MDKSYFEIRFLTLKQNFYNAMALPYYSYEETKKLESCGVYIISNEMNEVIYVGKTGRNGKIRLRELVSDYRSHTLNRKLLRILLSKELGKDDLILTNKTKKQLIDNGDISEERFKLLQKKVNEEIRIKYKFRFYEVESKRITEVEHFFIAVINPIFND